MRHSKVRIWAVAVALLLSAVPVLPAHAQLDACTIGISPSSVTPGSDNGLSFGLYNSNDNPIQWVQITRPPGDYFTLESASASAWTGTVDTETATFTDGNLPRGYSQGFSVQALASNSDTAPVSFTAQVSDDPTGANAITCDGDMSVAIAAGVTPVNILDVSVTGVSSSGVTINWDTDTPSSSRVDYGTDSSYGTSTMLDPTPVTSHSVTLSGLASNTGYHFQVTSANDSGGTATSGDNTFLTAVKQAPVTQIITVQGAPLGGGAVPLLAVPTEKVPPTVSFTSNPAHIVKAAPTITGVASDNVSVAQVQYSTDGGRDWLPVDRATGLGTVHATFSFTPPGLDDGNYTVVARAIDTSGNIGLSAATISFVVDRLPPLVGGNVVSLGPQILMPDASGVITSLVGVDQKITVSAVGGPTGIALTATPMSGGLSQVFSLVRSSDTGLWSGVLSFLKAGTYSFTANAIDGAGNKTSRILGSVYVLPPARTVDSVTHQGIAATVTVYYFEPDSNSWVVWDGGAYGQTNPQPTDNLGNFETFLPPGKYYLQAESPGHRLLLSSIFTITQSKPLAVNLVLKPKHELKLGPLHLSLPSFAVQRVNLNTDVPTAAAGSAKNSLIGKPAPDFSLYDTTGKLVHTADLLGRPTVITIGATWSPAMADQTNVLSELQTDPDVNVIPVALQDGVAKVNAYTAIAGLKLIWLADPDSTLSASYGVQSLPMHYFIDRKGIIRQVVVGIMSKQEILDDLSAL